jgi:hypothetical protein
VLLAGLPLDLESHGRPDLPPGRLDPHVRARPPYRLPVAHIEAMWTDTRPKSLIAAMGG